MVSKPGFGQLNSAQHSQEPEALEPENVNGLDLIVKNNQDATKPNIIKKIIGPFKGMVFKGIGDQTSVKKSGTENDFLSFLGLSDLAKHRIQIPELHSHLPDLGEDIENVPASIAALYPEFLGESSDIPQVKPGTIVWCNYLDRTNFTDPVYLGPIDDKQADTTGGVVSSAANFVVGLLGTASAGDSIGGNQALNANGQTAYNNTSSLWSGTSPTDTGNSQLVLSIANNFPDGAGGPYKLKDGGAGVVHDIVHNGRTIARAVGSTYCSGFTFTVVMDALNSIGSIKDKSRAQIEAFRKQWYGGGPDLEKQNVTAMLILGVGGQVTHEQAVPGDFCQFFRSDLTAKEFSVLYNGHSVVFTGWVVDPASKKNIGFTYRSTQGSGPGSGVSNRTEYFNDNGPGLKNESVRRSRTYFARLNSIPK